MLQKIERTLLIMITKIMHKIISMEFPILFTKLYYNNNKQDKILWNGKRGCLTLSWDCDLLEDIKAMPQILDSLSQYLIKFSFSCVGKWIEKYPDIHKRLLSEGHEIINHSYTHPSNPVFCSDRRFDELSAKEQEEEIVKCHEICRALLDYEPIGFRTPHFTHSGHVDLILEAIGYRYSSSRISNKTPGIGRPFFIRDTLLEFPLSFYPKEPFTVFETWHLFRSQEEISPEKEDDFFNMLKLLLNIGIKTHSYINIYLDPMDIAKFRDFRRFLIYLKERNDEIWIAKYEDLVKILNKKQEL